MDALLDHSAQEQSKAEAAFYDFLRTNWPFNNATGAPGSSAGRIKTTAWSLTYTYQIMCIAWPFTWRNSKCILPIMCILILIEGISDAFHMIFYFSLCKKTDVWSVDRGLRWPCRCVAACTGFLHPVRAEAWYRAAAVSFWRHGEDSSSFVLGSLWIESMRFNFVSLFCKWAATV